MKRLGQLLCLTILLSAAATRARAADAHEDRLRRLIARLPPAERQFVDNAKYAGVYALGDLVRYSNQDGRLVATFHLPETLVQQFADPAPLLITVEGSPHCWSVGRRKGGTLDEGFSMVTLTCYAPDETAPFNRYSLSSDGQSVLVSAGQMFGKPGWLQTVSLSQSGRALNVAWRLEAEQFKAKRVAVADFDKLTADAPGLVSDYLRPVLRRIGAARPASDVYQVFDQIPADPAVKKKLRSLLIDLESPDATAREAAVNAIKALGRPGVLACLRTNPSTLSPEQLGRLRSLYASEGWLHVTDFEAARRDVEFLSSCTEDDDPRVRSTATTMLAAIQGLRELKVEN
jgi:hypothetical protein